MGQLHKIHIETLVRNASRAGLRSASRKINIGINFNTELISIRINLSIIYLYDKTNFDKQSEIMNPEKIE